MMRLLFFSKTRKMSFMSNRHELSRYSSTRHSINSNQKTVAKAGLQLTSVSGYFKLWTQFIKSYKSTMNYNAILDFPTIPIPQLTSVLQVISSKLHLTVIVFFFLLSPIYFWLITKTFQKILKSGNVSVLGFILVLCLPVWFGFKYCKDSFLQHILVMAFLHFKEWSFLPLALLIPMQPQFGVLIVVVIVGYRGELGRLGVYVGKLVATSACLEVISRVAGIEALSLKCGGLLAIHPHVYPPNANLIWFLFTHMFEQYRLLFEVFLLVIPLFSIFPLTRILCSIAKPIRSLQQASVSILLFLVYYFSLRTTLFDVLFYMLLKLPGYHFFSKHVVMVTPFEAASVLFVFISMLVSYEWATNFTVQTSFLFFMVMPLWALQCIINVEVVGAFANLALEEEDNDKKEEENCKKEEQKTEIAN